MDKQTKIQTIARALNRAGLVGINPPPGFLHDVAPWLWRAAPVFRAFMIRPDCPDRAKRMRGALERAAARFETYGLLSADLEGDQRAELFDIARDLRAALPVNHCPPQMPFGGGALS